MNGGAEVFSNFVRSSSANFVDSASGDFRLTADSGAVDSGAVIPGITDGYAGAQPDAGALELGEAMWVYGHNFALPPYPTYNWQPVAYMNLVSNSGFATPQLGAWTAAAGSPQKINGNAWNYKDDALGIAGTGALELNPGDKIQQVITGLASNTHYEFSVNGRIVYDIVVEDYDSKLGTFTSGHYRDEDWLGDLDTGEWLCFSDINFGTTNALFNRVEIGQQWDTFIDAELRLDSPTGTLLTNLYLPGGDNRWYPVRQDIDPVTGTHDLYLVFLGDARGNAMIDKMRFLHTENTEVLELKAAGYDDPGSETVANCDGAYWSNPPDSLLFTTGSNSTSVTISINKAGGS